MNTFNIKLRKKLSYLLLPVMILFSLQSAIAVRGSLFLVPGIKKLSTINYHPSSSSHSRDYAVTRPSTKSSKIQNPTLNIDENPFRFSSYYFDSESGLYYLHARYYSPELMRFINRDTFDLPNRYAYGNDNPINKADPNGHMANWLIYAAGCTSLQISVAECFVALSWLNVIVISAEACNVDPAWLNKTGRQREASLAFSFFSNAYGYFAVLFDYQYYEAADSAISNSRFRNWNFRSLAEKSEEWKGYKGLTVYAALLLLGTAFAYYKKQHSKEHKNSGDKNTELDFYKENHGNVLSASQISMKAPESLSNIKQNYLAVGRNTEQRKPENDESVINGSYQQRILKTMI